jgi:hypothetical protein
VRGTLVIGTRRGGQVVERDRRKSSLSQFVNYEIAIVSKSAALRRIAPHRGEPDG